jgi:hypothetical protein
MTLSFGQWVKLGLGTTALMKKHAAAIPVLRPLINDALDLWQSVVPPEEKAEDGITHAEAIEKIRTGALTPTEQAQFDRASQSSG